MVVNNNKGQAIFEMLIFLPLFIFLMTIIFNVGNSINVAINQQKVVRRYFYYLAKGNSYLPIQSNIEQIKNAGVVQSLGIAFTGYKQDDSAGTNSAPTAPCFKFNSFFTGATDETCKESSTGDDEVGSTNFIRIYSGYGVCGDSYARFQTPFPHFTSHFSQGDGEPDPRSSQAACIIGLGN
jgi:hypothetical protein